MYVNVKASQKHSIEQMKSKMHKGYVGYTIILLSIYQTTLYVGNGCKFMSVKVWKVSRKDAY